MSVASSRSSGPHALPPSDGSIDDDSVDPGVPESRTILDRTAAIFPHSSAAALERMTAALRSMFLSSRNLGNTRRMAMEQFEAWASTGERKMQGDSMWTALMAVTRNACDKQPDGAYAHDSFSLVLVQFCCTLGGFGVVFVQSWCSFGLLSV